MRDLVFTNFGTIEQKYRKPEYNSQWNVIVSYLNTDRVENILEWIQIVYKNLTENGIWVIACFSSFEMNVVEMNYGEFREIISKSQFKVEHEQCVVEEICKDDYTMISEMASVHYLVLRK